jgi:hypothetical protein
MQLGKSAKNIDFLGRITKKKTEEIHNTPKISKNG